MLVYGSKKLQTLIKKYSEFTLPKLFLNYTSNILWGTFYYILKFLTIKFAGRKIFIDNNIEKKKLIKIEKCLYLAKK